MQIGHTQATYNVVLTVQEEQGPHGSPPAMRPRIRRTFKIITRQPRIVTPIFPRQHLFSSKNCYF